MKPIRISKPRKYRNVPTAIDGVKFPSKKEANRYAELRLAEKAGAIAGLEPHPKFRLEVNGHLIGTYTADSRYVDTRTGEVVVEDVKSVATRKKEAYRLRKRLMVAIHGIEIREV